MIRLFTAATILAFSAACAPAEVPESATSQTEAGPIISYAGGFMMEPIGGRDMTMGGVTLTVESADTRLVSASSPMVGTIELHTMAMTDGKMTMRQVEGFDIKAGETFALERGGNHMMMFEVSDQAVAGETIDITLEFETGAEDTLKVVVPAEIRAVGE